ncbi:MAG: outer membrane beta-barrel domain-containing protein [Bdellovibrionaceae bacterium]|nr:outer membrane beta-barrel domain-containing protein [Bdellovibrionales bacterium]MCB9086128.1 outer membrane beta-barrel domain-containing protein [Pseudobdellovibrionaceae bacterium]
MLKQVLLVATFSLWTLPSVHSAWAQFEEDPSETSTVLQGDASPEQDKADAEVEDLYDKFDADENTKREKEKQVKKKEKEVPKKDPSTLSELSTLAPFSDIAVIQRRFLPKTKRWEFAGSLMGTINNPFFTNLGAALRGGYYFEEKYGVEAVYFFLSSNERAVTDNLRTKRNVKTESLVTPEGYIGADFKWTPMYGKMTFMNKRIVPFDFYFSAGIGLTKTDQGGNEPTVHLATGQAFALSKKMAVRWDLSWNLYQAKTKVVKSGTERETTTNQDDLYLSLGVSFFFPEATYR